jgi:hypothetical protein
LALEKKDRSLPGDTSAGTTRALRAGDRIAPPPMKGEVGTALRSAYEQTVGENIPSELLDLLGKLT